MNVPSEPTSGIERIEGIGEHSQNNNVILQYTPAAPSGSETQTKAHIEEESGVQDEKSKEPAEKPSNYNFFIIFYKYLKKKKR